MKFSFPLLLLLLLTSCHKPIFKSRWTQETAPETFTARFETSKGNFDLEITRSLSPKAADRFYQLVKHGFFNSHLLFYRVVPKFVAQFGTYDTVKEQKWSGIKIPDEPVIGRNTRGSVSYARSTAETRGTHLFINTKDNPKLDTIRYSGVTGFPAFGKVISGMEVVDSLYNGYADKPMSKFDTMYRNTSAFMELFPKLDSVKKAYVLKRKK